jgi:hypothetical protein
MVTVPACDRCAELEDAVEALHEALDRYQEVVSQYRAMYFTESRTSEGYRDLFYRAAGLHDPRFARE